MYNTIFVRLKTFVNKFVQMFKKHNFTKFVMPIIVRIKVSVQFIERLKKQTKIDYFEKNI